MEEDSSEDEKGVGRTTTSTVSSGLTPARYRDRKIDMVDVARLGRLAPLTLPRDLQAERDRKKGLDKKKAKEVAGKSEEIKESKEEAVKDVPLFLQEQEGGHLDEELSAKKVVGSDVKADVAEQIVEDAERLHLSDSEESEREEWLGEDFVLDLPADEPEQFLFFQFPQHWPDLRDPGHPADGASVPEGRQKRVSFVAPQDQDSKDQIKAALSGLGKKGSGGHGSGEGAGSGSAVDTETAMPADGIIGELVVTQKGQVKMRIGHGTSELYLDVCLFHGTLQDVGAEPFKLTAGAQSSFIQQILHIPEKAENISVLGEISRRYVASANIDKLLSQLSQADADADADADANIKIDT